MLRQAVPGASTRCRPCADVPAQLRKVAGGKTAGNALKRLIDIKTQVQYVGQTSGANLTNAQRQPRIVVEFADKLIS